LVGSCCHISAVVGQQLLGQLTSVDSGCAIVLSTTGLYGRLLDVVHSSWHSSCCRR